MGKFIDLTGQRFGRLTVLARAERSSGLVVWECKCDCGEATVASTKKLRNGRRVSCGCYRLESTIAAKMKHGHSSGGKVTPELNIWMGMRGRCNNKAHPAYQRYGGRGITVCERWDDFSAFLEDMGPRPGCEYSLERKDNDRGYEPDNCVWATRGQQCRNRRSNIYVELGGNRMCLSDAAVAAGIGAGTVRWRLHAGWPMSRLFEPPSS